MNKLAIKVENLTKTYNLGVINYGTLYRDLQSFFARVRGKEDPNKKIGFGKLSKKLDALNKINIEIQKGEIYNWFHDQPIFNERCWRKKL